MVLLGRRLQTGPLLTKTSLAQHGPEGCQALTQDLVAMRHEEKTRFAPVLPDPLIVEGRHDGLPCASGRDHQVPPSAVQLPFRL